MNPSNKLLSDLVATRTYSKYLPHLQRREALEETINRVMQMHLDRFPKLSREITKAFSKTHLLQVMPSMRALQFGGEPILANNARGFNCSYAPLDTPRRFSEGLFLLLSGCGFGYSVQKHHVNQLPSVQKPRDESRYIIPDSIEGWAQALQALLDAYFYRTVRPVFDFTQIRAKGARLKTSGAKAPGPEPLKTMLKAVENLLVGSVGRKLKPIEAHDLMCLVSECVLAGGIRRAAMLSLFDRDDKEMLKAKSGNWWEKHPYRARANNSAMLPKWDVKKDEFRAIMKACEDSKAGEPGIFWTNDRDMGTNPCLTGDTLILTKEGPVPIRYLVGHTPEIWNGLTWVKCDSFRVTAENVEVWGILIERDGGELDGVRATSYHRWLLADGTIKTTAELKREDSLQISSAPGVNRKSARVVGITPRLSVEEKVYCCTVESTGSFALANGIQTLNCAEISLSPTQFCNLTTINLTTVKNEQDFLARVHSATLIGTLQAAYTDFPYLSSEWRMQTEREALLGVSMTGCADVPGLVTPELLRKGAEFAKELNVKYAKRLGINPAARLTAIKPEGTASCVLGSSSGIHARKAPYYIRRFQISKDDALYHWLLAKIPDLVEDYRMGANTAVVAVPQASPSGSVIETEESSLQALDRVLLFNQNWVAPGHVSGPNKHNVSCTLSVKDEEWSGLVGKLWDNREHYTGISCLPFDGGTYEQAPFEPISQEKFEQMCKLIPELDLSEVKEVEDTTAVEESIACSGGACELTFLK